MNNKTEIQFAWELWHLTNRLNDLIWNHYEDNFIDLILKHDDFISQNDPIEEDNRYCNDEFKKNG